MVVVGAQSMDLKRAKRNFELVTNLGENWDGEGEDSGLEERDVADTQVPNELEFSSSPVTSDEKDIFVCTQIQSRLDDLEREESMKGGLKRFKYEHEECVEVKKAIEVKKGKPVKKRQQKSIDEYGESKGGKLLKQLSGKHSKVKSIIESQRRQTSVRGRAHSQYDTYNAEEWGHIYRKLLERFPQSEPGEMKQVFHHLYGEDQATDLWVASQQPPVGENSILEVVEPPEQMESHGINVLTLSQVMSDKSVIVEPDDDDLSTIPDSTDDTCTHIPIEDADAERASTQFYTPRTTPAEEIIDLTQESFKVVKSLISPLKNADTPMVQVPATRTSTVLACAGKGPCSDPAKCLIMKLPRRELTQLREKLSGRFDINTIEPTEEFPVVHDTEAEELDHCTAYLNPKMRSPIKVPVVSASKLTTHSAQKLRQSIKMIGLKPSRSKSQMIASLEAASQVLDSTATEVEQRQLIYDNLTKLVQASPSLLERVYTFQPINVEYLVSKLIQANPFVDQIDELTIRAWADSQGICLTNS